jgi:hypothetical protein
MTLNGKIVINVDGKAIDAGDASVNLRKTLQANNIDVYPLKAKLLGLQSIDLCCVTKSRTSVL